MFSRHAFHPMFTGLRTGLRIAPTFRRAYRASRPHTHGAVCPESQSLFGSGYAGLAVGMATVSPSSLECDVENALQDAGSVAADHHPFLLEDSPDPTILTSHRVGASQPRLFLVSILHPRTARRPFAPLGSLCLFRPQLCGRDANLRLLAGQYLAGSGAVQRLRRFITAGLQLALRAVAFSRSRLHVCARAGIRSESPFLAHRRNLLFTGRVRR